MHISGREMSPELAQQAAQLACEASAPISDVRASADYRRLLVETLVERALVKATERATTEGVI